MMGAKASAKMVENVWFTITALMLSSDPLTTGTAAVTVYMQPEELNRKTRLQQIQGWKMTVQHR